MTNSSSLQTNNYSSGTMFWYSVEGSKDISIVNAAIKKHLDPKYLIEPRTSKSAFLKVVRKNSKFSKTDWFLRKIKHMEVRITIAVVKEEKKTDEKLDMEQESILIYNLLDKDTDRATIDFRCSCGHWIKSIHNAKNIETECSSCGSEIPMLVYEIIVDYKNLHEKLDSTYRANHIRDIMYDLGAIRMSRHGRPFYTPEAIKPDGSSPTKEMSISNLLNAIKDWGDYVSIFPIMKEAKENVKTEAIHVFHDEIDQVKKEIDTWEKKTRPSTKYKRIESLEDIRKKLQLYSFILEDAKEELSETIDNVQDRIESIL